MKRMKIVAIVVLIILLAVLISILLATQKDKVQETRDIEAIISGWQDTGISVKPNSLVTITAVGICRWAQELNTPSVSPDGLNFWKGDSEFLAPGLPVMSLVAKIGDGSPVFVGSGPVTLEGKGVLYLGFNDDVYLDNSGRYIATISFESKESKPGYGDGDSNHDHSGPPGQQ